MWLIYSQAPQELVEALNPLEDDEQGVVED